MLTHDVLPTPLPLDTVLAWRDQERASLLAYGEALAREQAAYRAVEVWQGLYAKCRDRMGHMNPFDRERLHCALKEAEAAAIEAHQAAAAALLEGPRPFTALAESMSRACDG